MHVTHILNPPKPKKYWQRTGKKTEEKNGCHTHSQSTQTQKNTEKTGKKRRRKKGRRKWMSHTFSVHLNPEKYWKKQEKREEEKREEENGGHAHSQSAQTQKNTEKTGKKRRRKCMSGLLDFVLRASVQWWNSVFEIVFFSSIFLLFWDFFIFFY